MTYQEALETCCKGFLVRRKVWPTSTWLSPPPNGAAFKDIRVRTQKPFENGGEYTIYMPTLKDLNATDWLCRPSWRQH